VYYSSNIVRVIKSIRMKRAGHVARKRERRGAAGILYGKLRDKGRLVGIGVNWKIISKPISNKARWVV